MLLAIFAIEDKKSKVLNHNFLSNEKVHTIITTVDLSSHDRL